VHLLGPGSSGFVQIQRPHLPGGHALRQGALGEALARPLLAHLVASAARALSQHVRHFVRFGSVRFGSVVDFVVCIGYALMRDFILMFSHCYF